MSARDDRERGSVRYIGNHESEFSHCNPLSSLEAYVHDHSLMLMFGVFLVQDQGT